MYYHIEIVEGLLVIHTGELGKSENIELKLDEYAQLIFEDMIMRWNLKGYTSKLMQTHKLYYDGNINAQEEIKKIIAGVNFENEKENGFEAEVNQEGIDFKSKVAIYQGKQGDVWTISFNTTKSEWPKYSLIFNEILKNFSVKNNDKQI